jgi:hypothetical protein
MRDGLTAWMDSKGFTSVDEVRGAIDGHGGYADLFERGSYIRTLQSWTA